MHFRYKFLSLLLVVTFTSCSPAKSGSESKNASSEYNIAEEQEIFLADSLSQEEEKYIVFFHSDTCNQCKQIIEDVKAFAMENILKTYFLNIAEPTNQVTIVPIDEITVGVDNVDDLCIAGTPTIIEVENGTTTKNIPGKDKCLTYLNEQRLENKK